MNTSKTKIRVVIGAHIGEPIGGISIYYETLLNSSFTRRFDVRFIETSGGNLSFTERGRLGIRNWFNAIFNIVAFLKVLLHEKPNIVDLATVYGASFLKNSVMILSARLFGKIVVVQIHCSMERLLPSLNTLWAHYVLFVLKHVHGMVTLSREWDALRDLLPNANLCYVPNAIDVKPYQTLPRPRTGFAEEIRLLFFGHIGREKGCFDLLDALEQVHQRTNARFRMDFVGETLRSGEKETLSAQIRVRNLSNFVAVHEPEYNDARMQRLANSDVLILPSYHEGMPMSVIEAMAAGMAVIGSQVGGIPDQIIPGETGLLVPPGNVQALRAAILQLVENPQTIVQMGQAGRQRAIDVFDIETKAQTLENFYRQILANH